MISHAYILLPVLACLLILTPLSIVSGASSISTPARKIPSPSAGGGVASLLLADEDNSSVSSRPAAHTVRQFMTNMFDIMTLLRKRQLGDVWASEATTRRAFAAGEVRSIDLPKRKDEDCSAKVRVCFRNYTPDLITLCWMSYKCEPYHFYQLEPIASDKTSSNINDKKEIDTVVVDDKDHVETTSLGHAFVMARRTSNHERKGTQEAKGSSLNASDDSSSVSDGSVSSNLSPPPAKKRLLDLLTSCDPKQQLRRQDRIQEAKNPDGRYIACGEVFGGYRPTAVSLKQDGKGDSVDRIHVVTITRKKQRAKGFLCGGVWEKPSDNSWEYFIQVGEGTLDKTPLDTADKAYRCIELGGWPVRCEDGLWNNNRADSEQLNEEAKLKDMIANDLAAASRCLPPPAREALRDNTPIWINRSQNFGPKCAPVNGRGMCFHPDKEWLVENGMSAKKEACVEMYRVGEYSKDRHYWGEGGVLLHELSHAYHHKCLEGGYNNTEVLQCYKKAMKKGLYDKVRVHGPQGPECRAYACTDQMEYFAELSSAFLGGLEGDEEYNKWYPFNRKQIKEHDPDAYDMLGRAWKVDIEEDV